MHDQSQKYPPLRVGERVELDGEIWKVMMVNSCRALIRRCGPGKEKRIHTAMGETVTFSEGAQELSVSPNSELERVR